MGKHTPGPWKIVVWDDCYGPRPETSICAGFGKKLAYIADLSVEQTSANANLISAAPDLREACVEAATTLADIIDKKTLNGEKCEEEKTVLDLIVIALTKARGELK